MSTFTLAISCLTTSNLPWFMDLGFQVPMQYCSLQHRTLLLSPVTSTAGYCFCFGFIPSFFLELFLHWSPVAYWAPTDLLSFSVSYHFAFSYCSWGSQGKNTEVVSHSVLHLDSILKSRDITLPTKVHLVKAMVFPVIMYGCESWTVKKLSTEELMVLNCGVGEDSWESLGLQGDPVSPS